MAKQKFTCYVDGLPKSKRAEYRKALKLKGLPMGEVKGIRKDENSPLTRLADAIAGFVRDGLEKNDNQTVSLFQKGLESKLIIPV